MAVPIILVAAVVAFTGYCLFDLARATEVRSLSRGVWAIICLVSQPWGGILYLAIGKMWSDPERPSRGSRSPLWHGH